MACTCAHTRTSHAHTNTLPHAVGVEEELAHALKVLVVKQRLRVFERCVRACVGERRRRAAARARSRGPALPKPQIGAVQLHEHALFAPEMQPRKGARHRSFVSHCHCTNTQHLLHAPPPRPAHRQSRRRSRLLPCCVAPARARRAIGGAKSSRCAMRFAARSARKESLVCGLIDAGLMQEVRMHLWGRNSGGGGFRLRRTQMC